MGFDTMRGMEYSPREIRIAVEIEKRTDGGIPVKVSLKDQENQPIGIYLVPEQLEPDFEPVTVDSGGGVIYLKEGGLYTATFQWTLDDEKKREFVEEIEVDIPPTCPQCRERVPGLADYICDECRYGIAPEDQEAPA